MVDFLAVYYEVQVKHGQFISVSVVFVASAKILFFHVGDFFINSLT